MHDGSATPSPARRSLQQFIIGFLGVTFLVVLFPRLIRLLLRQVTSGILTEVLGVVAAGLVTGRMAGRIKV